MFGDRCMQVVEVAFQKTCSHCGPRHLGDAGGLVDHPTSSWLGGREGPQRSESTHIHDIQIIGSFPSGLFAPTSISVPLANIMV